MKVSPFRVGTSDGGWISGQIFDESPAAPQLRDMSGWVEAISPIYIKRPRRQVLKDGILVRE